MPEYRIASAAVDGRPVPVVILSGRVIAIRSLVEADVPDETSALLADWPRWRALLGDAVARVGPDAPELSPDGWRVPVRPSKLICIGVNYHDHLAEMGGTPLPDRPYSFLKPVSTGLVASGASVDLPAGPSMIDWEGELALVIGRRLRRGDDAEALEAVAGYTVYNDLSARDWIASTGAKPPGIDWMMMKGYDGFSPIGPFVTPAEFVADPQDLAIRCWVNGELKQDSSTSQMIFGVRQILEHLSAIMTLEPGDVIATGTPAGVGYGARPQQFLKPGDRVAVEIAGLGRLETLMTEPRNGGPA